MQTYPFEHHALDAASSVTCHARDPLIWAGTRLDLGVVSTRSAHWFGHLAKGPVQYGAPLRASMLRLFVEHFNGP